ncbi:acetate--CoA ligase family protein [Pukyongiella litopenaei]|uniref:Acetate--CoA ligase family protein n=1 Tax=Pukyongiella litopenaei TaxID=2605946 RepID=A0A2S0MSN5_9RHOB|nr:acetate--CoA ligase family protein [Pukyongiella litopenaei]AVO38827.1 acetate--CoA ligase family protein [Pukyongiella litopenaei]
MRDLSRLFRPRHIAVIGGGDWAAAVIRQAQRFGFDGPVWHVHPRGGDGVFTQIEQLPDAPDAAFIGINRHATVEAVQALSDLGAGGAVCFASGFSEARAEDAGAGALQAGLVAAAADMPILGPNCYGFVNALDRVAVWPDQHGLTPVTRGVAILTQSSNIAINLTMQRRALPIACIITCGNMAQVTQAEIATALLDDPRITAIGLHVEGFGDLRAWERLAARAHARGIPLVAIKVGASEPARAATVSHTAALAGSDAGAQAFLDRLGIPRLQDLSAFLECLKLLHCVGPLTSNRIGSISCSGGEASLLADLAAGRDLCLPPLSATQRSALAAVLGPMVALANPLDYHTYIWRDAGAMTRAWAALTGDGLALTLSVVDYPTTDRADWSCATQAAIGARARTGAPFAVVSSLPELMPVDPAEDLIAGGVVPMAGLDTALAAIEAAARHRPPDPAPVLLPGPVEATRTLSEARAKAALAACGLAVPRGTTCDAAAAGAAALSLAEPLAVKGAGLAHKTEHGAVRLGLARTEVAEAARMIGTDQVLIEEMVPGAVAELLIGVTRDPAHGFVLTLGAGGVLAELLADTVSLLVPAAPARIEAALRKLKLAPLLAGYRGKPAADMTAILDAVRAVQAYVLANAETVAEVEINPLLCTPDRAVAADALIRKAKEP